MNTEDFVVEHLPSDPARVLEVGCGDGELTLALERRGHDVTGIDPEAPEGSSFRRTTLERFDHPGPFDAVVANRSLHHIHDLRGALNKIHSLLAEDGVLIVGEFAWDRMDEATASWYQSHAEDVHDHSTLLPENFPSGWIEEHDGMHTADTLVDHLRERFDTRLFEWVPYIAHNYLEREDLVREESELIHSGQISAIGFRFVGKRMS